MLKVREKGGRKMKKYYVKGGVVLEILMVVAGLSDATNWAVGLGAGIVLLSFTFKKLFVDEEEEK